MSEVLDLWARTLELARRAETMADNEFHIESIDGPCESCAELDRLQARLAELRAAQ